MLTSQFSPDGTTLTISPQGRFDFKLHREFRDAYTKVFSSPCRYVINLSGTDYLDSSALGMLLLLRVYAGGDQSDIHIVNCKPDVLTILRIANFHQLFKLA
jgi:anti-anti-sigma factor